jgi:8-oxo-dGTP pyrophosphatase MutT (NUDIX family)
MWPPSEGRTPITPDVVDVCVLHRERAPSRVRADAGAGHRWRVLLLERAADTRCPGSWEVVHGRIEAGERPEDAAMREVREETGLEVLRLYCVTVNAFYLAGRDIKTAIVFAAVVGEGGPAPAPVLGPEHVRSRWLTMPVAARSVTWPREREALGHIAHLLRTGTAGVAEDVLRVR